MEKLGSSATIKYECLLFDMDDTLYPLSSGLGPICSKNIEEFMMKCLNIEESRVHDMSFDLYREYGTTFAGLKALGYEFDDDAFHSFVHGTLPYDALKPDLVLRNLLLSLPQRKLVFTNADRTHATQVLSRLGLEDCFEGVICLETLNTLPLKKLENGKSGEKNNSIMEPSADTKGNVVEDGHSSHTPPTGIICKPAPESFQAAIIIANLDPKKTIFFDDSTRNIAGAKAAGFHTVIVGRSRVVAGADHALSSIHNMRQALPELWEGEGEVEEQISIQSAADVNA